MQLSSSPFLCSPCFFQALGFSLALGAWFVTCLFTVTVYMSSTPSSSSFSLHHILPLWFFSSVVCKPVLEGPAGGCGRDRTSVSGYLWQGGLKDQLIPVFWTGVVFALEPGKGDHIGRLPPSASLRGPMQTGQGIGTFVLPMALNKGNVGGMPCHCQLPWDTSSGLRQGPRFPFKQDGHGIHRSIFFLPLQHGTRFDS